MSNSPKIGEVAEKICDISPLSCLPKSCWKDPKVLGCALAAIALAGLAYYAFTTASGIDILQMVTPLYLTAAAGVFTLLAIYKILKNKEFVHATKMTCLIGLALFSAMAATLTGVGIFHLGTYGVVGFAAAAGVFAYAASRYKNELPAQTPKEKIIDSSNLEEPQPLREPEPVEEPKSFPLSTPSAVLVSQVEFLKRQGSVQSSFLEGYATGDTALDKAAKEGNYEEFAKLWQQAKEMNLDGYFEHTLNYLHRALFARDANNNTRLHRAMNEGNSAEFTKWYQFAKTLNVLPLLQDAFEVDAAYAIPDKRVDWMNIRMS